MIGAGNKSRLSTGIIVRRDSELFPCFHMYRCIYIFPFFWRHCIWDLYVTNFRNIDVIVYESYT